MSKFCKEDGFSFMTRCGCKLNPVTGDFNAVTKHFEYMPFYTKGL